MKIHPQLSELSYLMYKKYPRTGLTVNSSENRRHLANGIVIAKAFAN